jgi:hypothetical protein
MTWHFPTEEWQCGYCKSVHRGPLGSASAFNRVCLRCNPTNVKEPEG